jgi:hypothetical protein
VVTTGGVGQARGADGSSSTSSGRSSRLGCPTATSTHGVRTERGSGRAPFDITQLSLIGDQAAKGWSLSAAGGTHRGPFTPSPAPRRHGARRVATAWRA